MWGIANIAADCSKYRDSILFHGGLPKIVNVFEKIKNLPFAKRKTIRDQNLWAISNLIRSKPIPNYQIISVAMPVFQKVLQNSLINTEVLNDILWSVSYMTGKYIFFIIIFN